MDFDDARRIALALPEVEEGTWFRTPCFRVRKKSFARLKEDGDSLVVKCNFYERRYLLEGEPDVFYITDHYRDHPYVLLRLSAARPEILRERLEEAWRLEAPKRLLAEYDRTHPPA